MVAQFEAQELHAARSGREVMEALASAVADSPATSVERLAAEVKADIDGLLRVMPAYAPPLNVMHRVYSELEGARTSHCSLQELRTAIAQTAASYRDWSAQAREKIGVHASALIPSGSTVFTFTLSETVLGVLREASRRGVQFRVLVTESRPNNDGRITARSLSDRGIEVGIGIDANVGDLAAQADLMLVGAEAVLCDGSAICKVGTYPAALAARRSGIPLYILVDTLKLHVGSLFGEALPLDPIERTGLWAAEPAGWPAVAGHLFDRTPAALISGVVTERGVVHPTQVAGWMLEMPFSEALASRMRRGEPSRERGV